MQTLPKPGPSDAPLLDLLGELEAGGYDFVTPTPATHARVLARRGRGSATSLRDILGWSLPFEAHDAPPGLVDKLEATGMLIPERNRLRSAIRVSRVQGRLFVHSAFPTEAADAVFLGPDSYRFADFIAGRLDPATTGEVLDVGGGAGVGAIVAAGIAPDAQVSLTDINPQAVRFARVNAAHAAVSVKTFECSGVCGPDGPLAAVIANPPYMAEAHQTYRNGGDMHGARLSLDWATAALERLAPGGRLLLYTGSAILSGGRDPLREGVEDLAARTRARLDYRELDPDVFGEELETPAYADVERIAVIGCVMTAAG